MADEPGETKPQAIALPALGGQIGDLFETSPSRAAVGLGERAGSMRFDVARWAARRGIRSPVALRLRVRDFDFEAGTVSVPAGTTIIKKRRRASQVSLSPIVGEYLQEWSKRCGSEWMFPGKKKSCTWSIVSANKQLVALCAELVKSEGTTIEMVRQSVYFVSP